MTSEKAVDVVVIGGGPAGATASTLVAQRGFEVALFERERFPRFHIGESLIPETYWVLKRLGMLDKMKNSHFVKKLSVQFMNHQGRLSEPFYFMDNKPHECSQTWQVYRQEFDQMMLQNAADQGVQVHEATRVGQVLFEGNRATGVSLVNEKGETQIVRAKVVIDASGQSGIIMNQLGLRVWDPDLKKAALWTYWKGAYRDQGRDEGATMVLQTKGKKGWFWYIPLHNDIVSVGVVADHDYLFKRLDAKELEKIYFEQVALCPGLLPRIEKAQCVAPFRVQKEYTYRSTQVAGDGWVLVGDAFGFLDPLYSSGVLLALRSGAYAADAVAEGLSKSDTSAAQLGKWGPEFIRGMDRMKRLVCEYYDGFSFGRFVKRHPHLKGHITDLLIGDLFEDKVDDVIAPLDEMRAEMDAQLKLAVS